MPRLYVLMSGSFISLCQDLPHAEFIHFPSQGSSPCQYPFPMPGSFISQCQDLPHARIFPMPASFISPYEDLPHASIIHFPITGSSPCQYYSFPWSSPCQYYSFPLTRIFPMSVSFPHARIFHMPRSFISPYQDLPHASIIHFTLQGSSPCQYNFPIPGSSPCQHHSLPHARIFPMPALFTSPARITASSRSVSMTTLYGDLNHLLQSAAFWVLGDRVTVCTCSYICRQHCVYMFIYM